MQFNPDAVTRVASVNGEQTRVITIYIESAYPGGSRLAHDARVVEKRVAISAAEVLVVLRSEERRGGKVCSTGWPSFDCIKKMGRRHACVMCMRVWGGRPQLWDRWVLV